MTSTDRRLCCCRSSPPIPMSSTVDPPAGFTTRPEAPNSFNRSQRALERELEKAQVVQDQKVLQHWKLITKDGVVRDGSEVTTDDVKKLQAEGMVPTWCVEESYLAEKYGRRGEPDRFQQRKTARRPQSKAVDQQEKGLLPDDVDFLKERIRILQHEKEQEAERNEKREAKLFAQLEVKDRQISAWDEVSQGLTKALATGQLTPNLIPQSSSSNGDTGQRVTQDLRDAESDAVIDLEERHAKAKSRKATRKKKSNTKQRAAKKTAKTTKKPTWADKHIPNVKAFLLRS